MQEINYSFHYKHLVIVHGIGDQAPNETALNFINQFIRSLPYGEGYHVKVENMLEKIDEIKPDDADTRKNKPRRSFTPANFIFTDEKMKIKHVIGFSEVFWKHIPDGYLEKNEGSPPIPIFTWAHSINTRFLERGGNYHRAKEAITNIEKMLGLLDKISSIYKKSSELKEILNKFLGDVQFYTESKDIREEINQRFLDVLGRINSFSSGIKEKMGIDAFESNEIYVIAHSEGTVVSYNSMVQAEKARQNNASGYDWLKQVKGFVTMGSPIDKHYTIWKNRFEQNHVNEEWGEKIPWFNYWDYSDPVAYGMKVLYEPSEVIWPPQQEEKTDAQKMFDLKYDTGFTRYSIPGAAHVAYWNDTAIYEDIINRVMNLGTTRASTVVKSKSLLSLLMVPVDWILYYLMRIATVAALIFFANKIISPLHEDLIEMQWIDKINEVLAVGSYMHMLKFILISLILGDILWYLYGQAKNRTLAKTVYAIRALVLTFAFTYGLIYCLDNTEAIEGGFTDGAGYLTGFVVAILVWRLHTTIHRGIIQLWRYTKGSSTAMK